MKFYLIFVLGLISATFITGLKANDEEEEPEVTTNDYIPPQFIHPTLQENEVNFVDWFQNTHGIGRKWFKSNAKKEGAEEEIAMYNGEWYIGTPANIIAENDYGLVVKTKARHHAIAASLREPFDFSGKPLIVQYEVKYEEGQECGGGYIKLLSSGAEQKISTFTDRTPYTIMFGPDKCGQTAKVHLIFKIKNPKNGTISEHHVKDSGKPMQTYFEDKKTHLYTLKVTPENDFTIYIDNSKIISGSLLKDLIPPVEPEKEIADPSDKKPADWDEREYIVDPEASKPEDWDENQPKEIVDENAEKPFDWLEEEEPLIPDPTAKQPEDWDEEIDSKWEPKLVDNPKCSGISGCGKWSAPMIANPLYKGKWVAPKIKNPEYKGKWTPKMIENPNYYEPNPYKQLETITALGFELWTMSAGIIFDNILITDDENIAHRFAAETFTIKKELEDKYAYAKNPSKGIWQSLIDATEEKPWLWAVYVVALLIPTILVAVFCFGKKSSTSSGSANAAARHKKTDEPMEEDVEEEQEEEIIENIEPEAEKDEEEVENVEEIEESKSDAESQKSGKSDKSSTRASPKPHASPKAGASRQRRPRKD